MNRLNKISLFLITVGSGTSAMFAQTVSTQVVVSDTIVKKEKVVAATNLSGNPFNPLMDFLPRENYTADTSMYGFGRDEDGISFFRPEVFVEKSQPKFSQIEAKFNPSIKFSALPVNNEIIGYWEKKNKIGLDFNQIAFVNWSAGGDNSISGLGKMEFGRKYIKGRLSWENKLNARYGVNKQSERELRKTDDVLEINSTFGYKTSLVSNWYYVSKLNFKTQLTDGYNYPNVDNPVSRFFAPAYLFVGVGAEYFKSPTALKYYISPLTYKTTFVLDQVLADQGAFGVNGAIYDANGNVIKKGKNSKAELGFLLSTEWKKEVFKNIMLETKLSLYSDYVDHFGNVDVMWDFKLDMKVNNFVQANIGMSLVYDDNIKTKVERNGVQVMEGPRVQFKQTLGVGLVYSF